MNNKITALLIIIGGFLFGLATLFHPPLSNPWDTSYAYRQVAEDHHWILDHCVFLAGLFFWLMGLANLPRNDVHVSQLAENGSRLLISSLGMWLLILSIELAVLPQLIFAIEWHGEIAYRPIWNVFFTFTLFSGYVATGLIYIAILLICASLRHQWMRTLGLWASFVGAMGIIGALVFPNFAIWVQLSTAPLPFLWTFWLAGKLLYYEQKESGSSLWEEPTH